MEQNIHIVKKLNEANHDYQVLRRRALFRRKTRLSQADKLKRSHEAEIHRTIGVDSYMAKQRRDTIHGGIIAVCLFVIIYSLLLWSVL